MADKEFVGNALYATWVYTSGTIVLNTESRNFSYVENVETIDATAGADLSRRKLASFKNATAAMTMTAQSDGTVLLSALVAGTRGSLIFGEAGTATGSPKTTLPCMSLGITRTVPFADVVTYDISWESTGDPVQATY
jgi:hypothetical protein